MTGNYDPNCSRCDLFRGAESVCVRPRFSRAPGDGWEPDVLFVGEAPGYEEDKQGRPFVGPAGKLLDMALEKFGLRSWAMTSLVRCRPPINVKPKSKQIKACAEFLEWEFERYRPRVVVPLGAVAFKALTGLDRVTDWAGRVLDVPGRPWKVFPVLHPAAAVRYPERFGPPFESQMRALGRYMRGEQASPVSYVRTTLAEAIERLHKLAEDSEGPPWGFDIETAPTHPPVSATNPKYSRIVTAAVATGKGEAFWWEWPKETDVGLLAAFERLLACGRTMVAHNAPMEVKHIRVHVLDEIDNIRGTDGDPPELIDLERLREWSIECSLLLYYCLHEDAKGSYDLTSVRREVCPDMADYDKGVQEHLSAGKQHHEIPIDELGEYNAGDADAGLRIANALRPKVKASRSAWNVWTAILRPAVFAISEAELNGRRVDADETARLRGEYAAQRQDAIEVLHRHKVVREFCAVTGRAVEEFKPGSSQQVSKIVFDMLGLPILGYTKKMAARGQQRTPSTSAKYLEPFTKKSRFVRNLLAWKEAKTLDGYLEQYIEFTCPNGMLYCSFILFGTSTGRPASLGPNAQNVAPRNRQIVRSRFRDGMIVVSDYGQFELRMMAQEAGCTPLLEGYQTGADVHALTAVRMCSELFKRKVTLDEVVAQHAKAEASHGTIDSWRQEKGKRPNFGFLYDAQPPRISVEFGVTIEEAETLYAVWHEMYPEIHAYHDKLCADVQETGIIRSRLGRTRHLPAAMGEHREKSPGWWEQKAAFREAINHPIQSVCSDLNLLSWIRAQARVRDAGMRSLAMGTTHDSQEWDAPGDEVEKLATLLPSIMVEETLALFPWITVPLAVDVKAGPSWGSLSKIKKAG